MALARNIKERPGHRIMRMKARGYNRGKRHGTIKTEKLPCRKVSRKYRMLSVEGLHFESKGRSKTLRINV